MGDDDQVCDGSSLDCRIDSNVPEILEGSPLGNRVSPVADQWSTVLRLQFVIISLPPLELKRIPVIGE